jgi:hypothetical protein
MTMADTTDEHPDVVRVLAGLAVVVVATIALLVGVGIAVAKVVPSRGGNSIVEPDAGTPSFADATALGVALGCADPQPFDAFESLGPEVRSYQKPTALRCAGDGTIVLVYANDADRRVAEQEKAVSHRLCGTVAVTGNKIADTVTFGVVRGTNWIAATATGRTAADALQAKLGGGLVVTTRCEATI